MGKTPFRSPFRTHRRVTVLQADRKPGGGTRFVDQVVRYAPSEVRHVFFSWPRAIWGRYDVFHVHWPEFLLRASTPMRSFTKVPLYLAFVLRLSVTRTPVIRTIHNVVPHHEGPAYEKLLLKLLTSMVRFNVVLNESTPVPPGVPHTLIPHGDYRESFASYPKSDAVSGRLLAFGRIERYKSVDVLMRCFRQVAGEYELRVAGRGENAVVSELEQLASGDARVTTRFEFLSDADLVREVTSSELVVLPYDEVHNSGVALVSLSLNRPIIARRGPSTELLQREAGPYWVYLYDGEMTPESLEQALVALRGDKEVREAQARLLGRDWSNVATRYAEVVLTVSDRRKRSATKQYFINPSGQRDNLGDSVLRRPYLQHLRSQGALHVYTGTDDSYASGLGLEKEDVQYRSRGAWLWALTRAALRRRAAYAINAGEIVLDRRYLGIAAWQIPVCGLIRLTGGDVVALGIATRSRPKIPLAVAALRATLALASKVAWRDPLSGVARADSVMPDWAFAIRATVAPRPRDILAVTFRSDRPPLLPSERDALKTLADQLSLKIVVVTQVRRDEQSNSVLAEQLGATLLSWPGDRSHAAHEEHVRELYARTSVVVSDRIHALIIAATEGAVPVGYSTTTDEKIARTFSTVLSRPVSVGRSAPEGTNLLAKANEVLSAQGDLHTALQTAPDLISAAVDEVRNDSKWKM